MSVEIFGKSSCIWCDRAQQMCEQYGIAYVYKSLDDRFDGEENMKEFKSRLPNAKTVPQIFRYGKLLGGFTHLAEDLENSSNAGQGNL